MPFPTDRRESAYGQDVPLPRRLASFAIALAINLLLLLMLIFMSPSLPGTKAGDGRTLTFNVNENNDDKSVAKSARPKAARAKSASTAAKAAPKASVTPPVVPPTVRQPNMILLNHDEFAASDISKLPDRSSAVASAASASAGGGGEGMPGDTGLAGGKGPHGEPLYNAEWYRRPTAAEMRPYEEKAHIPDGGWAEIACRTIARFHVEDCVILGDSPPGSHLGLAVRDAAWQFLIRPPRVGGKSLVGAWVRIHYTLTVTHEPGPFGLPNE